MAYDFDEVEVLRNYLTKFPNPHNHKLTFNIGEIVPIYKKLILPHDEVDMSTIALCKTSTPIFQTMDNAFLDIHYYYVPMRLLWKHFKEWQGERTNNPHEQTVEYSMPQVSAPRGGWAKGTIADQLGIPTKVEGINVQALLFRAYTLIYNEYYRDEQRQDFADFDDGDANATGSNGNTLADAIKGGACLKACKLHDYFTSTLLAPQLGEPVTIPLGSLAPVKTGVDHTETAGNDGLYIIDKLTRQAPPNGVLGTYNGQVLSGSTDTNTNQGNVIPSNLWADLAQAQAPTVNMLRRAFQTQKILEAMNRGGNRYIEQLRVRWNIKNPSNAELQRPQFLGGKRIPLNVDMVVQNSATGADTTPLGQIGGFSNTWDKNHYFTRGFEEHGFILGLAIVRHQRTYQQGLDKIFSIKDALDLYQPEYQNLGEQPVYNKEIYAQGNAQDDEVFGFAEYGAEYRTTQNYVTGEMRSNAQHSLDFYHYADDYSTTPSNADGEWIKEDDNAFNRTLAVKKDLQDQIQLDVYFDETDVRLMPAHSIPGFIDHH